MHYIVLDANMPELGVGDCSCQYIGMHAVSTLYDRLLADIVLNSFLFFLNLPLVLITVGSDVVGYR